MISEFSFNHQHTKETELKCSIPILLEKSQLKSGRSFQILCISAPQSTDQSINTFPRKYTHSKIITSSSNHQHMTKLNSTKTSPKLDTPLVHQKAE